MRHGHVPLLGSPSQWAALLVAVGLGLALLAFGDLTPRVEADFFFSSDDPQLQGSRRIEREFGQAPQVFIAASSARLVSREYLARLHRLAEGLLPIKGVL